MKITNDREPKTPRTSRDHAPQGNHAPQGRPARCCGPRAAASGLRRELIDCWIAVTNAGGAAGFPFPPVGDDDVVPVADGLLDRLDARNSRLVVARYGDDLAGWVVLNRDPYRLVSHWGTIHHLQAHPGFRGLGVGSALVRELRRIARDELGLEQLHLAARGGQGLEDFYGRLGWREIGRWPEALRLAPDDTRDEVLMVLTPL
ncbi:GNAT family N-acetyltransferase [Streptomyces triculaminicus]|uniref:GNAT family N-acetyltransferase n=1 Tax=Streptomyces triculaminicus TaxID=2816232 RepID=UPI0037CD7AC3